MMAECHHCGYDGDKLLDQIADAKDKNTDLQSLFDAIYSAVDDIDTIVKKVL